MATPPGGCDEAVSGSRGDSGDAGKRPPTHDCRAGSPENPHPGAPLPEGRALFRKPLALGLPLFTYWIQPGECRGRTMSGGSAAAHCGPESLAM